jgi:hypothetical protein
MNIQADNYVVKHRDTIVVPKSVEVSRSINDYLSYVFLSWSMITLILYFSDIEIPEYVDVAIGCVSIFCTIAYYSYSHYAFKRSNLSKINPYIEIKKRMPVFNASAYPDTTLAPRI